MMTPKLTTIVSAFAFAVLGLLTAVAIAHFAPTPPTEHPRFEQAMFIVLPLGGAVIGWFIAYLATPFDNKEKKD